MDGWTTNDGPKNTAPWGFQDRFAAMPRAPMPHTPAAPLGARTCLSCGSRCLPRVIYAGHGMEPIEVSVSAYCTQCEGAQEYRHIASALFWEQRRRAGHSERLEGTEARA